jgi:RNA polymerase sigma factor (sigma-70 family)
MGNLVYARERLSKDGVSLSAARYAPIVDDWPMSEFSQLLERELPLIEKITNVICRRSGMSADDIEEFTAEVKLRLVKNDYAILRAYERRSRFTTYIATVIRRLLIDYRRHHLGKWHDSAEAQRLGRLGVDVERAMLRDGRTIQETLTLLREKHPGVTIDEIERIARLLPAKIRHKLVPIDEAESIQSRGEADRVVHMDMAARISAVVCSFIDGLPRDEQLIFRLRFDCDMTVAQISRSLHRDQQVLYRLLYKHFDALRAELTKVGVDARAVEDLIGSDSTLLDFRLKNRTSRPSEGTESGEADRQEDT